MRRGFRMRGLAASFDARTGKRMVAAAEGLRLCLVQTGYCLPWTRFMPVIDPESYVGQLNALKSDLREALDEVERHQASIAGVVKQGSRLARDQLEDGLEDALRQVRKMKRQTSQE